MISAQKKPNDGGASSGSRIFDFTFAEAGRAWNRGMDTHDIAGIFGLRESVIYANLERIRNAARKFRLAAPKLTHQPIQNFGHGPQTVLPASGCDITEATLARGADSSLLLAPFSQINNPAHAAHSVVTVAVSQPNNDAGEIGNVPKRFGQAHE